MDIPFEGQFNGYGVNAGAQPAAGAPPAYDAEVRARAAQMRAPIGGVAAAEAPKPTAIPSWLQRSGMFAARGASMVGQGVGMAARMFGIGLSGLGTAALLTHSSDAGAGSDYQVGNGTPATPDQLAQAKESAAGGVQAGNPYPKAFPSSAAPAPAAVEAGSIGTPWNGQPGAEMSQEAMGKANLATSMKAGFGARTVADNALKTGMTPPGTGGIRNNQTGQVTGITPSGYGVRAESPDAAFGPSAVYDNASAAGVMVGGRMRLRQIAQDNAQALAQAKVNSDAAAKSAEAGKHIAETHNLDIRSIAGSELAKTGDYGAAAAAAGGRASGAGGRFGELTTTMPDTKTGAVSILDKRAGTISKVVPTQKVSAADFEAAKKQHPTKTPAEIITAFRNQGHDVSGLKP